MKTGKMKGAFQLSLSFIVIVVIAVILLSLSITFLQSLFSDIGGITRDVTGVAIKELLDKLSSTGQKVGIAAPDVTQWKRGDTGSYAIGIRNTDASQEKMFYINVYLENVGGNLRNLDFDMLKTETEKWFTYPELEVVNAGDSAAVTITIKPSTDARPGIYQFRVVVCEAQPCEDITSPSRYGSDIFSLEIIS